MVLKEHQVEENHKVEEQQPAEQEPLAEAAVPHPVVPEEEAAVLL